jgi:hypothetical protein
LYGFFEGGEPLIHFAVELREEDEDRHWQKGDEEQDRCKPHEEAFDGGHPLLVHGSSSPKSVG